MSTPRIAVRFVAHPLVALITAGVVNGVGLAATLPTAPKTFDTTSAAPKGATLNVAAGGDLQAALDKAQLGDTIVLQAGATFTGPFRLSNKTTGSGWIYVVSSNLSKLPPPGTRVSPANASNMPTLVAPKAQSALVTVANSHHYRFVGIEFAPAASATMAYQIVAIGNSGTSPATLPVTSCSTAATTVRQVHPAQQCRGEMRRVLPASDQITKPPSIAFGMMRCRSSDRAIGFTRHCWSCGRWLPA